MFQINHCRILEPKNKDNLLTSGGERLWPNVRAIDSTGSVEMRMRPKAALSLAGAVETTEFVELAATGALNFPILCSIGVLARKSTRADDASGEYVDTIIVEAAGQDLLCARSMPNVSLNYLAELLHMVSPQMRLA